MEQKIFLAVSLLLVMNVIAQQNGEIKFHSVNSAGVLKGANDASLQLQTINGIKYKSFSGGIGIGLDNYYFRTVPLFVDLRKNIFEKNQTPFFYFDLGASIPWDRVKMETLSTSYYKSGLIYDMGIGYSFPLKGRFALNVSAGYSEKILNETRETSYRMWTEFPPTEPSTVNKDTTYYKYTFRRVSFKIGLSF